jgi:hypothetical protein
LKILKEKIFLHLEQIKLHAAPSSDHAEEFSSFGCFANFLFFSRELRSGETALCSVSVFAGVASVAGAFAPHIIVCMTSTKL